MTAIQPAFADSALISWRRYQIKFQSSSRPFTGHVFPQCLHHRGGVFLRGESSIYTKSSIILRNIGKRVYLANPLWIETYDFKLREKQIEMVVIKAYRIIYTSWNTWLDCGKQLNSTKYSMNVGKRKCFKKVHLIFKKGISQVCEHCKFVKFSTREKKNREFPVELA